MRRLAEVEGQLEERVPLEMEEFSRVLGGGIVPGSVVLIGGDPGIGKSTLTLQMAMQLADKNTILYVSGEESERQIKMRAVRLAEETKLPKNLLLVTETNLGVIFEHIAKVKPSLVIIDSIQTVTLPEMESAAGSISQVRESAAKLRELAKTSGITIFLIGHVTKEGTIAGPRVLEHIVDTSCTWKASISRVTDCCGQSRTAMVPPAKWGFLRCRNAAWWKCATPVKFFWQSG